MSRSIKKTGKQRAKHSRRHSSKSQTEAATDITGWEPERTQWAGPLRAQPTGPRDRDLYEKKVSGIVPGRPETYGGAFKDPRMAKRTFVTHTVPDVSNNTRIIGVCGITHYDDKDSPAEDGWFFSDFFLFNLLLKGEGAAQTWLCSDDCSPYKLIKRWKHQFPGGYLHGDPFNTRKVVLDEEIIRDNRHSKITLPEPRFVLDKFLETLRSECDLARKNNESVLVMVFGHGDFDNEGIKIGFPLPTRENAKVLLTVENFRDAIGDYVPVTLFTTACFSGGWAIAPHLNVSVLAAARPDELSESWSGSQSLGRKCGSIYATAVGQVLCAETSPLLQQSIALPTNTSAHQESTYAEFTRKIYDTLFTRVDKFAYTHAIKFSAQDDAWEMALTRRTGIPLVDFQRRYNRLKDYAPQADPSGLGRLSSRNPSTIDMQVDPAVAANFIAGGEEYDFAQKLRGSFGGKSSSMANYLRNLAQIYLDSSPGADSLSPNSEHYNLRQLIAGETPPYAVMDRIHSFLEFRMSLMATADAFLERTDVPYPRGARCCNFDAQLWTLDAPNLYDKSAYDGVLGLLRKSNLFSGKQAGQGLEWTKPYFFIAAAILEQNLGRKDAENKVIEMEAIMDATVSQQVKEASESHGVVKKAKEWFGSLGGRVRSLSPSKRLSIEGPAGPSRSGRARGLSASKHATEAFKRLSLGGGESSR